MAVDDASTHGSVQMLERMLQLAYTHQELLHLILRQVPREIRHVFRAASSHTRLHSDLATDELQFPQPLPCIAKELGERFPNVRSLTCSLGCNDQEHLSVLCNTSPRLLQHLGQLSLNLADGWVGIHTQISSLISECTRLKQLILFATLPSPTQEDPGLEWAAAFVFCPSLTNSLAAQASALTTMPFTMHSTLPSPACAAHLSALNLELKSEFISSSSLQSCFEAICQATQLTKLELGDCIPIEAIPQDSALLVTRLTKLQHFFINAYADPFGCLCRPDFWGIWGNLTALRSLELMVNDHTSQPFPIPNSWSQLHALNHLHIESVPISNTSVLTNLTALSTLVLHTTHNMSASILLTLPCLTDARITLAAPRHKRSTSNQSISCDTILSSSTTSDSIATKGAATSEGTCDDTQQSSSPPAHALSAAALAAADLAAPSLCVSSPATCFAPPQQPCSISITGANPLAVSTLSHITQLTELSLGPSETPAHFPRLTPLSSLHKLLTLSLEKVFITHTLLQDLAFIPNLLSLAMHEAYLPLTAPFRPPVISLPHLKTFLLNLPILPHDDPLFDHCHNLDSLLPCLSTPSLRTLSVFPRATLSLSTLTSLLHNSPQIDLKSFSEHNIIVQTSGPNLPPVIHTHLHLLNSFTFCGPVTGPSLSAALKAAGPSLVSFRWHCQYLLPPCALHSLSANCSSLERLHITGDKSHDALTLDTLKAVAHACPKLTSLGLVAAPLGNAEWMELFAVLPNLEMLCLEGVQQLQDSGLASLGRLQKLRQLVVIGCDWVSEKGVEQLMACNPAALEFLQLQGKRVSLLRDFRMRGG